MFDPVAAPPALVEPAGRTDESTVVRRRLESLIVHLEQSKFDVAELLHTIKSNAHWGGWGFSTYYEYTRSVGLKDSKARYLPKMVEVMQEVGISRDVYEPLGIVRLREITSLDPHATWTNPQTGEETPMREFILGFVEKGEDIELDDLKQHIRTLKGFVGENDLAWLNICVLRSTLDNTIRPALELAKNHIGSVGRDEEGMAKDASDGAALEAIAVEYINNPANNVLPEGEL